jgi:hypothetical protein
MPTPRVPEQAGLLTILIATPLKDWRLVPDLAANRVCLGQAGRVRFKSNGRGLDSK